MLAALFPPEYVNEGTNEPVFLTFEDKQFQPIPAQTARTVTVDVPIENHCIVTGGMAVVTDGAGALQAFVPATAYITDGTKRRWMTRPVAFQHLFGPNGQQPMVFPYRKFVRAGTQLQLTIASRATVDLTFRPFLLAMNLYQR